MSDTVGTDFISGFPNTPPGAPPVATDVALLGRPPATGSPPGTPGQGFACFFPELWPAILSRTMVAATGVGAAAGLLTLGVNIVTTGVVGGAVQLPTTPGTVWLINQLQTQVDLPVQPPAGGKINWQAVGANVNASYGSQLFLHSVDGANWWA